ncbi:MAG: NUDIX hydrolase [Candidatus Nanopelagicales bacterium]
MAKTGPIRAAGVVLLREGLVCVLHRPRQDDWSLPKGKLDPGENEVEAARRETIEETGSDVELGLPLTTQAYQVDGRPKTVHYWVGRERSGGPGFTPNKEIDDLRWVAPEHATAMLTYPRDADLVREALAAPLTTPLVVVRHTEAVRRSAFRGRVDKDRPLSQEGQEQARRLIGVLGAFDVRKVYSSDALRCLDTVRPYAHTVHAPVAHEPLLSEEGFDNAPAAAFTRLDQILGDWHPAVICSHRPVLPALLEHLAGRLGVAAPDVELPTGAAVVFHRLDRKALAVEVVRL